MIAFSQNLKPTKVVIASDTLRCFNDKQTRFIIKRIIYSQYCDTLGRQYEKTISYLDTTIIENRKTIEVLTDITNNQQSQLKNCAVIIDRTEAKLKKSEKLAIRYKKQRVWCFVGGVVSVITPIVIFKVLTN